MHPILAPLLENFILSGRLPQDAVDFLLHHECPKTAIHTRSVAETAVQLAARFGLDPAPAETAAWLHDISAVFPNRQRLSVSQQLDIDILQEEAQVPLLLHQKISVVIARQVFSITDPSILSAIGCHTTLKANPTQLEMLLFAADKLAWDKKGIPPYQQAMVAALDRSLEAAVWAYQDYLWHSGKLKVIHPWMQTSYLELKAKHDFM